MGESILFIIIGLCYAFVAFKHILTIRSFTFNQLQQRKIESSSVLFEIVIESITNYEDSKKIKRHKFLSKEHDELSVIRFQSFIKFPLACLIRGWILYLFLYGIIGAVDNNLDNNLINDFESFRSYCLIISCVVLIVIEEIEKRRYKKSFELYKYYCDKLKVS